MRSSKCTQTYELEHVRWRNTANICLHHSKTKHIYTTRTIVIMIDSSPLVELMKWSNMLRNV